jgi:hypothetical protein
VIETSTVNQTYTVYKPVTKVDYVDETTMVTETSQIEQMVTTYKQVTETQLQTQYTTVQKPVTETQIQVQNYLVQRPVTETTYQNQQYTVQRPVTETTMQNQTVAVQRPVTETVMQPQTYTSFMPVTTYQPAVVDAGGNHEKVSLNCLISLKTLHKLLKGMTSLKMRLALQPLSKYRRYASLETRIELFLPTTIANPCAFP